MDKLGIPETADEWRELTLKGIEFHTRKAEWAKRFGLGDFEDHHRSKAAMLRRKLNDPPAGQSVEGKG